MYIYDVIAFTVIGFSHLWLYSQLIRYKQLSIVTMIALSIGFMILLGIVVTVTGYPEFNLVMLVVFLFCVGMMKPGLVLIENFYFVLTTIVSLTLMKNVLMEIGLALFMRSSFNLYLWTNSLIHMIVALVIVLVIVIGYKPIRRYAAFIVTSKLYYVSYGLLIVGTVLLLIVNSPTLPLLAKMHAQYGEMGYVLMMILFLVLFIFTVMSFHLAKQKMVGEHQRDLDEALFDYVESLERTHDELAGFRHDYMNVLLSLDEGVRTKDMKQIERVYFDVIAPTSKVINHQELDIVKLSAVQIPELKSMLSVKVIAAQQQRVEVMIDIPKAITDVAVPLVDYIRMVSILLDNALEGVVRTKERKMQIAFFEMADQQYFVVRNSSLAEKVDMQALFEKGYSTKGDQRGVGLFSLRRMVEKMDHVTLETVCKDGYFSQTLVSKKG